MATFKSRGIVLKVYDIGESDKMVTLLLKEKGRISAYARGARKSTSKLMAATQPFTYGEYVVYEKNGFLSITQAEIIENYYQLRMDYDKLCYAYYFIELAEKTIMEDMPCDETLFLIIKSLWLLAKHESEVRRVAAAYQIKFFKLSGYEPETITCQLCGKSCEDELYYFTGEGLICDNCASLTNSAAAKISGAALQALRYILYSETKDAFSFRVSDRVLDELEIIAKLILQAHFDVKLVSLQKLKGGL